MPIDAATRILIDFISVDESNGNYNATIGHADATADLSKLTLTEIYALQDSFIKRGQPSTAIGRYQFLKHTLQGIAQQKRLPPNTLFTPALQDEFAVQLLVGRGYSRWWVRKLSDTEFMHNLSMEWASLPDPYNGGRSHYDGDAAGNHAGRTLAQVSAMLRKASAAIPI